MALITEVRFAHERGALADTLTALPGLEVTVSRDARTDPGQSVYLIQFEDHSFDAVQGVLAEDRTVNEVRKMPGFEERHLLGIEFSPGAKLLNPEVTRRDGFVLEAHSAGARPADGGPRGWHERWLLPDGEALHDVWKHARDEGFEFEVLELRQHGRSGPYFRGSSALTEQQREALLAAYEHGYFTEPRETSLEELAEVLGISPTAVGGRLRRGMKSLIGMTLVVDQGEQKPPR